MGSSKRGGYDSKPEHDPGPKYRKPEHHPGSKRRSGSVFDRIGRTFEQARGGSLTGTSSGVENGGSGGGCLGCGCCSLPIVGLGVVTVVVALILTNIL